MTIQLDNYMPLASFVPYRVKWILSPLMTVIKGEIIHSTAVKKINIRTLSVNLSQNPERRKISTPSGSK